MQIDKINFLFDKGIKLFQNQKIDDAMECFETVLQNSPNDYRANHALGVIYGLKQEHKKAKNLFQKSLDTNPNFRPSLMNLAISMCELNEFSESEKLFNNIINTYGDDSNLYFQFGVCLSKQKNFEKAELIFEKSLNLNSSNIETLKRLGIVKKKLEKYQEAQSCFLKILELEAQHVEALYQLGDINYLSQDYHQAINYFNQTILATKDNHILLNSNERLARSYDEIKNYEESINIFKDILDTNISIDTKERILFSLSNTYINSKEKDFNADYTLAQYYAKEALKINDNNINALNCMGITNLYMRNHDESLKFFQKAHNIDPQNTSTIKNLSNAYNHLGLYEEDLKIIEKFKKIKPEDKSLDFSVGMAYLHLGKFKEAWPFYESRWDEKNSDGTIKILPNFSKPRWQPELGYNNILIWGEQGIGDQILHGTMLRDFSRQFKKVYLAIDPKLVQIFSESFPEIVVYSLFDETSTDFFDYHIPLCSIGAYTRGSYKDFSATETYYHLSSKSSYSKSNKLKCALSWKSVNGQKSDFKSTTLDSLKPILEIKNIDFYSIQYSDSADEIRYMKEKYGIIINTIDDLDLYNDIYGLMNFIQSCNFTITTSSTSAHLSGALNIPTYLLLAKSYGKFWYWDNFYMGKNVWYPSIEKFTQKVYKDWSHPINELSTFLRNNYNI